MQVVWAYRPWWSRGCSPLVAAGPLHRLLLPASSGWQLLQSGLNFSLTLRLLALPPFGILRLILIKLHLYLGLLGGAVLCVIALTGALYAYEPQLRAWWGEPVTPANAENLLTPAELDTLLLSRGLEGRPVWFLWPEEKTLPLWVGWESAAGERRDFLLDPVTGERLPRAEQAKAFFQFVLDLHRTLAAGEAGAYIVGVSSIALLILAGTGLMIGVRRWKDASGLWVAKQAERRTRDPRLRWRYWHRIIGAWTLPALLILPLTGMVWSFDSYAAFLKGLGGPPRYPTAPQTSVSSDRSASTPLDRIWKQAMEAREGEGAMRLALPSGPGLQVRFEWSPPNVNSSAMRSRLYFDPVSGELLEAQLWEDFSAGERLVRWAYPIHTGRVWGFFGQTLAFLSSLTLPFFFVTGLYLYVARRRKAVQRIPVNYASPCTELKSPNAPSPSP